MLQFYRMRIAAAMCLVGIALPSRGGAQTVVTLAEVMRSARRDPPAVFVAHAEQAQARAERGYAEAQWAPALRGTATAGYAFDNSALLPGAPAIDTTSIQTQAELGLEWAALDVARGARIAAAEAFERARAFGVETAQQRAVALAAELYVRAGAQSELVRDAEVSVERRTAQLAAAKQLVQAGTRSPVDAQRAQIEVLSAEYALSLRRNEERASFAALAAALGRPADELMRPAANTASFTIAATSPRRAKELAEANRPELRGASANVAGLRHEADAATGERWPTFGASANGSVSWVEVRSGVGVEGTQYGATAGVYLRWQGFDPAIWGRSSVSGAAAHVAERERARLVHAVGSEAVMAYYALERAKTEHQRAVAVLEAAAATREAQNGRYTAGVGSLLELLDAEDLEQRARQFRIEAERDETIAALQLHAACGVIGK